MEDYTPNSHKYKAEQKAAMEKKKVEKVITGQAKLKKKSGVDKLSEVFISEDAKNVKSYIFMDVLVPAIKKAISDIVRDGIDMILYGETRGRKSGGNVVDRVSYNKISSGYSSGESRTRANTAYSYEDIILTSRGDAEELLYQMRGTLETYGMVTVADMYDMVGITGKFTDCNYGWTNLDHVDIRRNRDGYVLDLPRAIVLK